MENRYDKYKDSGIAWIGVIPEHWEVRKGKNIFKLRNSKGNSNAILLAATQKYGMIPQSQIEGVVQVKQNTNLNTFKTVHKHDYVISLRSFQGGFEISEYEGVCSPAYQVFYSTIPCIIRKTKRCDFPERSVRFCKTKCILGSTPTLLLISQNRPAYAGNVKRRLNTIQTPFALRFVASLPPMLSR